jgi:aconitate hydratase
MNYLASPPLVIAYSLAGTMDFDFDKDSLGKDETGKDVYLKDIWPTPEEVHKTIYESITSEMFTKQYSSVFEGDHRWKSLATPKGAVFDWDEKSTYVRKAPYFDGLKMTPDPVTDVTAARVLVKLGDSVTTDHISPAGSIKVDSPAGKYLQAHGVSRVDFNSYGSRRGNHEVMIRGTFANIRLRNQLLSDVEGPYTRDFTTPSGEQTFIFDASENYRQSGVSLVVLAGKEYGSGSSRDWAAKGTSLLGVRVVIAESFERIHRSNLIGMGVLPLQYPQGQTANSLGLDGTEIIDVKGIEELNNGKTPKTVRVIAKPSEHSPAGKEVIEFDAVVRIDTPGEADYFRNGGILQYVLRSLVA